MTHRSIRSTYRGSVELVVVLQSFNHVVTLTGRASQKKICGFGFRGFSLNVGLFLCILRPWCQGWELVTDDCFGMINILTACALTHPPCVCVRLLGLAPKDQIAMEPILCEAPSLFAVEDETEKKKEIHTETNRKTETERQRQGEAVGEIIDCKQWYMRRK